jgi:hypothetical protein
LKTLADVRKLQKRYGIQPSLGRVAPITRGFLIANTQFIKVDLPTKKIKMTFAKAIAALSMSGLMAVLGGFGITPDMPLVEVIEILVIAATVYLIPNAQREIE